MKYTAKLTHYAFDNTYTNARLFENKAERDAYFVDLVGYTQNTLVNFNARDILATDIIVKVEPNAPLFNLLNYNYCIISGYTENQIEKIDGIDRVKDGETPTEVLYFFIKKSSQESGGQIRLYLENDIIQNYWYDIDFAECMINRAHLNRFEEMPQTTGYVKFRSGANSDLFEREDIKDVAKRLIKREKMRPIINEDEEGYNSFNQWVYDNVIAWCYVMVSSRNTTSGTGEGDILSYKDYADNTFPANPTIMIDDINGYLDYDTQISYAYMTFCFPIMKRGKSIIAHNSGTANDIYVKLDYEGLVGFLNKNKGYSYVHTIKLSAKPPIMPSDFSQYVGPSYNTTNDTLTINDIGEQFMGTAWKIFADNSVGQVHDYRGMFVYERDYMKPVEFIVNDTDGLMPWFDFAKDDIINSNKNIRFNPKINNADYKSLTISLCGSTFDFDLQKLDNYRPHFNYFEMITADITKAIMTYKAPNNNGIYNNYYAKSYNGLIINTDLSLPIANSQYDTYLANNKNAYLSFENTQKGERAQVATRSLIGTAFGGIQAALTGGFGLGGLASSISDLANLGIKQKYERANFDMTMDNMKNAPDTLSNANGNAILNATITDIMPYYELYTALDNELKIANDIAYDNGYICNKYGNVKDYVNTRKYFNYISATITNVIGNVSNEVKNLLRQILANGIKLWHTDTINFDKENYEIWLEE